MSYPKASTDSASSNNDPDLRSGEEWNVDIVHSPMFGNHVVAKRRIQKGEVVIDEYAMLEGPDCGPIPDGKKASEIFRHICLNCYRNVSENDKCSECSWPICQNGICNQTAAHRSAECKILAQSKVLPNQHPFDYQGITVLRLILLKAKNSKTWNKVFKMEANIEGRRKSEYERKLTSYLIDFVRRCSVEGFADEILERLIGILEVNKYWSHRDLENRFGALVLHLSSFINHDCGANTDENVTEESVERDPGAQRMFVRILANRDIEPGEPITIDYIKWANLEKYQERQKLLKDWYYFDCTCKRCVMEMSEAASDLNEGHV